MVEIRIPLGEPDAFATSAEYGLYLRGLGWAMREAANSHAPLPAYWFIPDSVIYYWNERRTAKRLVADGKWEHDDELRGYRMLYVHRFNDPNYLRDKRKKDRARHPPQGR
jgi:hypothetical protein